MIGMFEGRIEFDIIFIVDVEMEGILVDFIVYLVLDDFRYL